MKFLIHQRALGGIVAGAMVLFGLYGCSRSDRTDTASGTTDTSRATTQSAMSAEQQADTLASSHSNVAPTNPSSDTATQAQSRSIARSTPQGGTHRHRSRTATELRNTTSGVADTSVSGYQAMERDTSLGATSDTSASAATSDTSATEMAGAATPSATSDTVTSGSPEMARDTSSSAGRGDTAAVSVADSASATADSGSSRVSDTATVRVQVDTTTAQAQVPADTTAQSPPEKASVASADSANAEPGQGNAAGADTLNAGRIRPTEDSTEVLGNVTGDTSAVDNSDVTSKSRSDRVRSPEDSTEVHGDVSSSQNQKTDGASTVDATGAGPVSATVTGADAVAQVSRAGERCTMINTESTEANWDIGDSPASLNPCGAGTMTLSSVRTGEKR